MYHSLLKDAIFITAFWLLIESLQSKSGNPDACFVKVLCTSLITPANPEVCPKALIVIIPFVSVIAVVPMAVESVLQHPPCASCPERCTPASSFFSFLLKSKTDELKAEELNLLLGTSLSVETVRRWRNFWVKQVSQSHTWKRAAFSHGMAQTLPASLLDQFQQVLNTSLKLALKWLLPLTAGVHLFDVPFRLVPTG